MLRRSIPTILSLLLFVSSAYAVTHDTISKPRVLIVDAHPDDETAYAGAIYKITHDLHGTVDLVVVTDGEGGYKYSTLAEPIYKLQLTNEAVGRKNLPWIRRKELKAAGKIIGLHHIYFLNQKDNRYTQDPKEVLDTKIWDTALVVHKIKSILRKGGYDFLFTLLPTDSTHGHHKAATILALRALSQLPSGMRPVALGATVDFAHQKAPRFEELAGYPITRTVAPKWNYSFDLTQGFGYHHLLNYTVIVKWEMAEHKSQGALQMGTPCSNELFWLYQLNGPGSKQKAAALFIALRINHYPELSYPDALK